MSVFAVATVLAELSGWRSLSPLSTQLLAVIAINQTTMSVLATGALHAAAVPAASQSLAIDAHFETCRESLELAKLGRLPKGLVVADVNYGSYIAALTHHSVLSAPYHRIDRSIIEADTILKAQPPEAERRLRALDASYVFECVGPGEQVTAGAASPRSLRDHLVAGTALPFLEPVALPGAADPLRVWRLLPPAR